MRLESEGGAHPVLQRTAVHEAGHAVVGTRLGLTVDSIAIPRSKAEWLSGDWAGCVQLKVPERYPPGERDPLGISFMAGYTAEAWFDGGDDLVIAAASLDVQRPDDIGNTVLALGGLSAFTRSGRLRSAYEVTLRDWVERCQGLVGENWEEILHVAQEGLGSTIPRRPPTLVDTADAWIEAAVDWYPALRGKGDV